MVIKKDDIQRDALAIAIANKKCGLGVSMGVGKTLIGLRYIEHYRKIIEKKPVRVLVVIPKLSVIDSWKSDADKFNIHLKDVIFTTYRSLNKHNPNDYDIVILDECHNLLNSHTVFLGMFTRYILGLTGTPPRFKHGEKGKLVELFCPIMFTYLTDEAINDEILNNYRLIIHKMPLDYRNNISVKLKNGGEFMTSESKTYGYWATRVDTAETPSAKKIAAIMMMKSLMNFKTKEKYAKKLLFEIDEKCICFANTKLQADYICADSVHSTNPDRDENFQKFKRGDITKLSCVLQLNEGVNIPELRAGIIMHSYGNERKTLQRLGRLLRLNPNDTAIVHILCYKDTIDETWIEEALKDLDPKKIKYFDV